MNTRGLIRQKIVALLRERGDSSTLADSDSLIMTGRLESVAVLELATFLEKSFGLDFGRIGFDQQDFDSVDNLVTVVARESQPSLNR